MRENVSSLLQHHSPGLRLRALLLARDAAQAERLVQSVVLHALRHAAELEAHPHPRSWLLQAMSRLAEPSETLAA